MYVLVKREDEGDLKTYPLTNKDLFISKEDYPNMQEETEVCDMYVDLIFAHTFECYYILSYVNSSGAEFFKTGNWGSLYVLVIQNKDPNSCKEISSE